MNSAIRDFSRADRDTLIAGGFFVMAMLGETKRLIELLPATNRQGLVFAAAASTLGLGTERALESQVRLRKKLGFD